MIGEMYLSVYNNLGELRIRGMLRGNGRHRIENSNHKFYRITTLRIGGIYNFAD
jgi:hypothetical protein